MTEQEWMESLDPVAMLDFLTRRRAYPAGTKPPGMPPPSERKLLRLAEAILKDDKFDDFRGLFWTEYQGTQRLTARVVWSGSNGDADNYYFGPNAPALIAHILHDIIGNPWRPVTLPHGETCEQCNGLGWTKDFVPYATRDKCEPCKSTGHKPSPVLAPLVLSLAEAVYTQRQSDGTLNPDALAVLWDALEDAGCGSDAFRAALLSPGPHYRGFWALDLILGRE